MNTGERIRFFRKKVKLTQKELAQKAGLAEITIRQYESGRYEPKFDTAKRIAAALEVSVYDLMDWDERYDVAEMVRGAEFLDHAAQIGGSVYDLNFAFFRLNEVGQQKVLAYIEDLLLIDAYTVPENE